ncbi:MAG: hypothetical protein AAB439_00795 [Patescibacteria group bacterium]
MREKFFNSLYASLEWRFFAFVITNLFLWTTSHSFWKAAGLALALQIILFVAYTFWHFVRHEHGLDRMFAGTPPQRS